MRDPLRHHTEHEANQQRIDAAGRRLDDAVLDRINELPPDQRQAACDELRAAVNALPQIIITD